MKNNLFPQPISEQIWNAKYKLVTLNPDIQDDMSVQDTWWRIANACSGFNADVTTDNQLKAKEDSEDYYGALMDFKFLPAGRIISGAGSGRNVTLFNCYVMGTIPDDMGGIFDMLKEAALTMQQGGGIGYDFSPLRPTGAPVKGVDADASGPISFMDVWDSMCRTIMSAGSRRGAMMATMRCDHPDIESFITAKRDPLRLRMFNVSVLATDAFMEAVKNDKDWPLCHKVAPSESVVWNNVTSINGRYIYRVIKAKELWKLMMKSTYDQAEPGVLFIDRINKFNNLWNVETISSTNPCGEQPLPPYGACLLGSINLAKMVTDPFGEEAVINTALLQDTTRTAVRMLDSVIGISNFPIPKQKEEALYKRRMGLGITGLHDALWMMGYEYGTPGAAHKAGEIMKAITLAAYDESIRMAVEFGPCPATKSIEDRENFIKSEFMQGMPVYYRDQIIKHGIRNSLLTSIAPTGTISIYAGNVSSGIEPIFAPEYTRKVLEDDGVTRREEIVQDYAVQLYHEQRENLGFDKDLELNGLLTAQDLTPDAHLVMQAAVQRWVDSSISKTINCPEDISREDLADVYMKAYDKGCKGCTTYRPNSVTGSVLSVEDGEEDKGPIVTEPVESFLKGLSELHKPFPRDLTLSGQTYKLKWEGKNFYVTINNQKIDGKIVPFEIFINTQDMTNFQWILALTRMMSSVFRRGGNVDFLIKDLKNIMDPKGGTWVDGKYIASFIALLGQTVENHIKVLSYGVLSYGVHQVNPGLETKILQDVLPYRNVNAVETKQPIQCPECSGFNVHVLGGCPTCTDCGYSKCG